LPQGNTLQAVSAVDSLHCFTAGGYGSVMKTSNGGLTWTVLNTGTTDELTGIKFTDTLNGWTISEKGRIFHTNNGGESWSLQYADPDTSYFTSLTFTSPLHGCVIGGGFQGGSARALTTWDGGASWEKVESGNSENIHSLYINGGEQCWSVGGNGCILTYSSIFNGIPLPSVIQPENQITVTPNPFRDRTVISYTLTEPQHVVLALYSVTGSKIQTLVNETQKSGSHAVLLDGTLLKPGVYVCQLQHGGVRQSVKLSVVPLK
jgi:hypothetical protein